MTSIQRFAEIAQAFYPQPTAVREAMAKSIIEAAKAGERDPVRLREAGLAALSNSNLA